MGEEHTVEVTVHPGEWVDSPGESHEWGRKQLVPAADRDPVTVTVPREDATADDGRLSADESYEANQLATHADAPDRVNGWDGAYFITLADG